MEQNNIGKKPKTSHSKNKKKKQFFIFKMHLLLPYMSLQGRIFLS